MYLAQSEADALTDDGCTIQDLEQSGCNLKSPRRESLMNVTLNGFGIQRHGDALEVHATNENFSLRKHNLVQAILAVNDMFYLTAPMVANLFYEDVVEWLESNNIRYTPRVKFSGKTGYDHLFDFVIPKSRNQPERIIQTMNRPNRDTAQSLVLSWVDTKAVRSAEAKVYAIMNDSEQKIPHAVVDALTNYGVRPFSWSERETKLEELVD